MRLLSARRSHAVFNSLSLDFIAVVCIAWRRRCSRRSVSAVFGVWSAISDRRWCSDVDVQRYRS